MKLVHGVRKREKCSPLSRHIDQGIWKAVCFESIIKFTVKNQVVRGNSSFMTKKITLLPCKTVSKYCKYQTKNSYKAHRLSLELDIYFITSHLTHLILTLKIGSTRLGVEQQLPINTKGTGVRGKTSTMLHEWTEEGNPGHATFWVRKSNICNFHMWFLCAAILKNATKMRW